MKKIIYISLALSIVPLVFVGFQNFSTTDRNTESVLLAQISTFETQIDAQALPAPYPYHKEDYFLSSKGICSIRRTGGEILVELELITRDVCLSRCDGFSSSAPDRLCRWRNEVLNVGAEAVLNICRVRSGNHINLLNPPEQLVTNTQCHDLCNTFTTHTYRYCDWGVNRFFQPEVGTECSIKDGRGLNLTVLNASGLPVYIPGFVTESVCQGRCNQVNSNLDRVCKYGNKYLKEPDKNRFCEIVGSGLGNRPLLISYYGSESQCQTDCATFQVSNPGRRCFYGTQLLVNQ